MAGFLGGAYLVVKALHVISVIFWMAGLFMLPRYFAYHMESPIGSDEEARWVEREAKIRKIILVPAMMLSWLLGLVLIANIGATAGGWLPLKLVLVVILTGFQVYLSRTARRLAAGDRSTPSRTFRLINEVPAVFIIAVVILAVVKPF